MSYTNKNTTQTIITVLSVTIALIAVVYALTVKNDTKPSTAMVPSVDVQEVTYEAGSDNPVVMTLNGRDITRLQIIDNFEASGSKLPAGTDIEQVFPLLQDQFLVGELLKNAAKEQGYTQDHPEIAKALNNALDQALRAAYIKEVGNENVSEEETKRAYEDIIKNAPDIKERRASHILVEDEAKARELISQLNEGADFAKLATENSVGPTGENGGDLGYFAQQEMVPEFANAAFSAEIGTIIQEPVQTQFGYHVIKVVDERNREKPAYEDVKEDLQNQLRQAVLAEEVQKLRQAADVTVYTYSGDPVPVADTATEQPENTEPTQDSVDAPSDAETETQIQTETNTDESTNVETPVTEETVE